MSAAEVRPIDCVAPDFPALHARTQGFSLGVPRSVRLGPGRVLFLRGEPDHPAQTLWILDADGERQLVDPAALLPPGGQEDLPEEERARRERARERASGVVRYACDDAVEHAVFTLNGKLLCTEIATQQTVQLAVDGPVVNPVPDPTGQRIAYVQHEALWVVRLDGTNAPRMLADDRHPNVSWGLAEFVAGEEMGRTDGFWWAPDGSRLIAARVDTTPVRSWWIAGPVDPDRAPTEIRYPAAGTPNADVTLAVVDLGGNQTPVEWDREAFPYLADVVWMEGGPPLLVLQSRDQQTLVHLAVNPDDGSTTEVAREHHTPWIELVPGSPTWTADGRLVRVVQDEDIRHVMVGDQRWTDDHLMIASILGVHGTGDRTSVLVSGHRRDAPWATVVASLTPERTTVLSNPEGVASATVAHGQIGISQRTLDSAEVTVMVHRLPPADGGDDPAAHASESRTPISLVSRAATAPDLGVTRIGPVGGPDADGAPSPVSVLLHPADWTPEQGPLPVLVDSYGGPHARRVQGAAAAFLSPSWFAANGFAVLVTDGPGAPGQSLTWEASIAGDLATRPLDGQVQALQRAADRNPGLLDLDRVAIRGWSFGGYLAALAVLRRPDVFHTAISGAPVTDWTLYDTHYTERYLGTDTDADSYARSSIVGEAAALSRPLLLLHGLADDNVVSAHTLRLSRALLEAGRPHEVLPLSGVTHFTPSATVNTNLLLLQLDFLRRSLGLT